MPSSADELRSLLTRLSLEHLAATLIADEELTLPLLRSMGAALGSNLQELDCVTPAEAASLARAIRGGYAAAPSNDAAPNAAPSAAPSAVMSMADGAKERSSHARRETALQAELFADDMWPPAGSAAWPDDELRDFFEPGGAVRPAASGGVIAGVLRVRWRSEELRYEYDERATVGELRAWLEARTDVPAAQQKLLGLGSPVKPTPPTERLAPLHAASKRGVMLMGTPQAAQAAAHLDLERGRRAAILVANDLNEPTVSTERLADADHRGLRGRTRRAEEQTPIRAQYGAGLYLDPAVWAAPVSGGRRADPRTRHRGTRAHRRTGGLRGRCSTWPKTQSVLSADAHTRSSTQD